MGRNATAGLCLISAGFREIQLLPIPTRAVLLRPSVSEPVGRASQEFIQGHLYTYIMHLFLIIFLALAIGCSAPTQFRKIIFGTTLNDFNTAQKKYIKTFAMKPEECFRKVHDIFEKEPGVIIAKSQPKNNFISAYGFSDYFKPKSGHNDINSTEVGVLFKEISEEKTEVIIISDNYDLAQFVADNLFTKLETSNLPQTATPKQPASSLSKNQ